MNIEAEADQEIFDKFIKKWLSPITLCACAAAAIIIAGQLIRWWLA